MNVHVLLAKPFQFNITLEFSVTLSQGLGWSRLVFCRAVCGTPSLQIFFAPLQISSIIEGEEEDREWREIWREWKGSGEWGRGVGEGRDGRETDLRRRRMEKNRRPVTVPASPRTTGIKRRATTTIERALISHWNSIEVYSKTGIAINDISLTSIARRVKKTASITNRRSQDTLTNVTLRNADLNTRPTMPG